jgi:hypothetical protein
MIRPPKSLLDPTFKYTNSSATDVAKTFARIRREMKSGEPKPPEPPANVRILQRRKA